MGHAQAGVDVLEAAVEDGVATAEELDDQKVKAKNILKEAQEDAARGKERAQKAKAAKAAKRAKAWTSQGKSIRHGVHDSLC